MTADRLDGFARAWLRCDLDELSSYLTEDWPTVPPGLRVRS